MRRRSLRNCLETGVVSMGRLRTQIRRNWPLLGLVVNRSILNVLEVYLPLTIHAVAGRLDRRSSYDKKITRFETVHQYQR